jgi:hypothetical protein
MKKLIIISFMLFSQVIDFISAQPYNSTYIGINLPPILGTAVELGYERHSSPGLTFELFGGYLINSPIDSPMKIMTVHNFKRKSGLFIKPGARFNIRRDPAKFAPFVGLHLVNSLAIENGVYHDDFNGYEGDERFSNIAYNFGVIGMIGITTPLTNRIGGEVGIQTGRLLIDNLIDFHSYMPGMGVAELQFFYSILPLYKSQIGNMRS